MVGLFPKKTIKPVRSRLEEIVLRGFGGGWNVVDDDTNMEPKFQVDLINYHRTPAGAQKIRHGTKWFADVASTVTGSIIDIEYFNDRIVAVTSTGQIATVTNAGV